MKLLQISDVLITQLEWQSCSLGPNNCNLYPDEGLYDGVQLVWQTPTLLSPLVSGLSGMESSKITMGVDGQLLDEPITAERGYSLDIGDTTVQISIPFNAAGGYRKVSSILGPHLTINVQKFTLYSDAEKLQMVSVTHVFCTP